MNAPQLPDEALFEGALNCRTPAERAAYLDQACAGQPELRRQLEDLLAAHDRAGAFLESAVTAEHPPLNLDSAAEEGPGTVIGRYKLLEKIGEGGAGIVYMAEQTEPIRRKVALKVIKLGMDTRQVVARFEVERQALALMDHPNIARVLDAGATDTGRPFFVMELVRGFKITSYCDQNNLSTGQRLDLFMQVCHAVQHAHQKGIIHRDLKPSNILVTLHDGVPVPKVIDFGIAKATERPLTDKTLYTAYQQFIGTPAYMSPEQAEMSGLDIDTRSDIYSLGVLLYELLTGRTPFEQKDLLQAGVDEMRRRIREKDPPKPSTRLSTLTKAELTDVAKHHGAEAPNLIPLVRGDLDGIVMRCLEKDRRRRYETTNALAMDVQRHLDNEPVVARPPSRLYRLQKLIRRNRVAFAAGGAVAAALILGLAISTVALFREKEARERAVANREKAQREAAKATAISGFLEEMLRSANPSAHKGSDYTVRRLLDDVSAGLSTQFVDQPEVEAALRATIGRAYWRLELNEKALAQHERALALRQQALGSNSLAVAESHVDCAWAWFGHAGKDGQWSTHWNQARPHVCEALAISRQLGDSGRGALITALSVQQKFLSQLGRYPEADAAVAEAQVAAAQPPRIDHPVLASMIHGMAEDLNRQGRHREAEATAREALAMHRRLRAPEDPEIGWALRALGTSLVAQEKLEEAREVLREALAIFRSQLPFETDPVSRTILDLSLVLGRLEDWPALEALLRRILDEPSVVGEVQEAYLDALQKTLQRQPDWPAIETLLRQVIAAQPEAPLKHDPAGRAVLARRLWLTGDDLESRNRFGEAERYHRDAARMLANHLPAGAPANLEPAWMLWGYGYLPEAEILTRQVLESRIKNRDRSVLNPVRELARLLLEIGRTDEAEAVIRDGIKLWKEFKDEGVPLNYWALAFFAWFLKTQGQEEEAKLLEREVAQGDNSGAWWWLSWKYATHPDAKRRDGDTAVELAERAVAATERKDYRMLDGLAAAYAEAGRFPEAVRVQREAIARVPAKANGFADRNRGQQQDVREDLEARLRLYQLGSPYRECRLLIGNRFTERSITYGSPYGRLGPEVSQLNFEGRLEEVESLLREQLDIRRKMYDPGHPKLDGSLGSLTRVLLENGKPAPAEPFARECLAIRQERIPDDWLAFSARSLLGGCLLGQQRYEEAESILLSAYEGMKERKDKIPAAKVHLAEVLDRLVRLYEETEQPDQAALYKEKLAESVLNTRPAPSTSPP